MSAYVPWPYAAKPRLSTCKRSASEVDAVGTGEHQVEEDQVGLVVAERVEGHVAAAHDAAVEALLAEHDGEHLRQGGVVVDDEHASARGFDRIVHGASLGLAPAVMSRTQ